MWAGTVRHERSGSGGMLISGPQGSLGSPRQACGYEVPGPASAWLPTPLATAAQVQHDTSQHEFAAMNAASQQIVTLPSGLDKPVHLAH